jgi:hypothetical protein
MLTTKTTVFFKLKTVWCTPFILRGGIIAPLAFVACQYDHISHRRTPQLSMSLAAKEIKPL